MAPRQIAKAEPQGRNVLLTATAIVLLAVGYWFALTYMIREGDSADLRALWLAGTFFDQFDPTLIFAISDGVFTMEPPPAWVDLTVEEGRDIPVYPFLYPPLWAWVASLATQVMDYEGFVAAHTALNRCLVPLSFVLAWRILQPNMSLTRYLGVALLLASVTLSFTDALRNNQLQILVSFLILLAIERQRAGWPISAGAALALAASIKLYPVLFAVVFLMAGHRKAFVSFLVVGGALGLASLSVAPWALHAAMLHELSAISSSYQFTRGNFSLGPLLAALTTPQDQMLHVTTAMTGGTVEWYAGVKTSLVRNLELAAMVTTYAALLFAAHRTKMRDPLLWPAFAFAISWLSPLAWVYHYITMLVFAPVLIERLGRPLGWSVILLGVAAISVPARNLLPMQTEVSRLDWVVGSNAGLLLLAITFALLTISKHRRPVSEPTLVPGE